MKTVGEVVPRSDLERVAAILGPASAAAEALKWADSCDSAVTFFRVNTAVVAVRNDALDALSEP